MDINTLNEAVNALIRKHSEACEQGEPMNENWKCQNCSGHIFVADIGPIGGYFDEVIWAHDEDTGCDDPGLTLADYIYYECKRQHVTNYGDFGAAWDFADGFDRFGAMRSSREIDSFVQLIAAYVDENPFHTPTDASGYNNFRRCHVGFAKGGSAAPANEIAERFNRWVYLMTDWINDGWHSDSDHDFRDLHTLIKQLLDIHPWQDGNGRTASILYNWCSSSLSDPDPLPYYYPE